jgi:hypothetical protein
MGLNNVFSKVYTLKLFKRNKMGMDFANLVLHVTKFAWLKLHFYKSSQSTLNIVFSVTYYLELHNAITIYYLSFLSFFKKKVNFFL